MSKKQLVREISDTTGMSQSEVTKVIDALPLVLSKELLAEGRAVIPGIGIASVKERKARQARNPKTGEIIEVPARQVTVIKVSKSFPV